MSDSAKELTEKILKGERKYSAVIPTGGKGGGMYPLTAGMPKALLPLDKLPLIVHILKYLDNSIFDKVIILCNDWKPMIESYVDSFKKSFDFKFEIIYRYLDEKRQPGNMVSEFLSELINEGAEIISDPFLLHYSDVLINHRIDWEAIIEQYDFEKKQFEKKHKKISAMLLASKSFEYPVGLIKTKSLNKTIDKFEQKPKSLIFTEYYANCAISFISKFFIQNHIKWEKPGLDIFDEWFKNALERKECITAYEIKSWYHFQHLGTWLDAQREHYSHLDFF
ncbi:MAG: hypothetical protein GTO45_34065 [Candidatus Aminicenantes bacterium]|nr:hypothetical protein [Candidatus Aminicenantes bacterium]NIM83734.1 hypothetical protein [Candidatus Aminicenantes bacterium]NIN23194.1 hypothetical protein [Candidatus Aminicenantes bacterium]NIN46888.1 hypothetical protein [Candidatus Aminicenantes bacterium]NIN89810.1 hypothetical protein [Candidatus Aminicenantes bacterium]